MHLENLFPAENIRIGNDDLPVETAGAQQCRIQDVRTVCRRDQDDSFVGLEPVHLDEQLVQGLFALVVAAAQTRAPMATHGVNFVDEDDARGILLPLFEHVAHPAGADTDEHLDEIRTRNREKRNVRFSGDGPRQQRLARARRSDEQRALGNLPAQALELVWILEVFDNLFQFLLRLVDSGDVVKGDPTLPLRQKARFDLPNPMALPPPDCI